jgi:hypothetical protein
MHAYVDHMCFKGQTFDGALRWGTFRERARNIQGTCREHSGNIQGTFRGKNKKKSTKTIREHSGNVRGTFGEHSGNIRGTFREHSGNIQGAVMHAYVDHMCLKGQTFRSALR